MAAKLDCLIEQDFQALAGATESTVETWRRRGTGPAYTLLGNRYLYALEDVRKFIATRRREPSAGCAL